MLYFVASPGTAETAVEAVNDGKIAAWTIHTYLQGRERLNLISNPYSNYY